MMRTAVYPGTFDPITNGHLDVIRRGLRLFDHLVVAVTTNPDKKSTFSIEERVALVRDAVRGFKNVKVKTFDGLLVDFLQREKTSIILRGLRELSDFEAEFQAATMNRRLAPSVETVFVMTGEKYFYLSSGIVKEIAFLGGRTGDFVPSGVEKKLRKKLKLRSAPA